MKFKKTLLCFSMVALLSACGSDSDPVPPTDPEEPVVPKPDYIDVNVTPELERFGIVKIQLGKQQDNITEWVVANGADENDYSYNIKAAQDAGIVNEPWPEDHVVEVDLEKLHNTLITNPDGLGEGSYRNDIFVAERYSVFDILRYLAITLEDLTLTVTEDYQTSGLGTPTFTISWDEDGDGNLDEVDNPNWHFRLFAQGDEFTRAVSNTQGFHAGGELNYLRMDEVLAQPNMTYNFQPFSEYMTARRHWVQKRQVERQKERGMVLQQFEANPPIGDDVKLYDIPVKPLNHRPDIFQPGVITGMDIYVAAGKAAQERGLGDFSYTFWNVLQSGADVGHYALTQFLGIRNKGLQGWLTYYIEGENYKDAPNTNRDVFKYPDCNWNAQGENVAADSPDKISKEICRAEWAGTFGGTLIHLMSDVYVHNYLPENTVTRYGNQYASWNPDVISRPYDSDYQVDDLLVHDFSEAKDGSDVKTIRIHKLPTENSKNNAKILTETHFGWGIADCTLCHNEEKDPKGHGGANWPTAYTDGFDNTQPAFCASCHGANGGKAGHGELDTCFWCHDRDLANKKHGEASTLVQVTGDDIRANDEDRYGNVAPYPGYPSDSLGNYKPYTSVTTSGTNHYRIGKVFPDPYSCLSCHPNED
ncbi:hypothetical protein [Shewanella sp. TC10]|uniref:hypothetical protein n=1 Tax=Shewanella sp. TC10 TaxID=1419739 RepID=UPI00129EAD18|nr:hypothetical protein [Shewanella sp. TC10]